jgi:hypothetical protein
MVRKGGLEPPCLSAPPPQDGVSANFTTSALKNRFKSNSLPRLQAVLLNRVSIFVTTVARTAFHGLSALECRRPGKQSDGSPEGRRAILMVSCPDLYCNVDGSVGSPGFS